MARLLYSARLLPRLPPQASDTLIVLGYHRIRPDHPDFATPFDDSVFGPTASQLAAQLQWLRRNSQILSENDLADPLTSRSPSGKPRVLVTFDDGYRDNYSLAFPILRRLGVPAIFFLPTHLINSRQLGRWDIIAYMLKSTSSTSLSIDGHSFSLPNRRNQAIRFAQSLLKTRGPGYSHLLMAHLRQVCGVPLPDPDIQDKELMSWEEVRTVSRGDIAIGSHTHTHLPLARLDTASQRNEMTLSKSILQEKIGRTIHSIAYPFGGPEHFTAETQDIARRVGYQYGFSYLTGVNRWTMINNHNIRRIEGPSETSALIAAICVPWLFLSCQPRAASLVRSRRSFIRAGLDREEPR